MTGVLDVRLFTKQGHLKYWSSQRVKKCPIICPNPLKERNKGVKGELCFQRATKGVLGRRSPCRHNRRCYGPVRGGEEKTCFEKAFQRGAEAALTKKRINNGSGNSDRGLMWHKCPFRIPMKDRKRERENESQACIMSNLCNIYIRGYATSFLEVKSK